MSDLIVAAPAAGWYPDPISDAQLRWWNGEGWTERTMAPPPEPAMTVAEADADTGIPSRRNVHARFGDPDAAEPGPEAVPYTEVDYAAARQAYAPERSAASPFAPATVPAFAADTTPAFASDAPSAFDWQQQPLVSRDSSLGYTAVAEHAQWRPSKTATAGAWGLAFLPWTATGLIAAGALAMRFALVAPYVPAAIGLIMLLTTISLAQRDKRRLAELGHERPASVWWVLLAPPLGYLIARTVAVHRNSGKGMAPLMMHLVNLVLVVSATLAAAIFLPMVLEFGR